MGIGGGTILVLYLTAFAGVPASSAAGINLVYFIGCAPPSLWLHFKNGLIDRRAAVFAALGGTVTALAAAWLVPVSSPDWLRRAFGVFLLLVGIRELWQYCHTEKKSG